MELMINPSSFDSEMMDRALELAERGIYTTKPNPRVGCVIVRDAEIVAEGWHREAGKAHAEIEALDIAGDQAIGADLYTTLEPCCHVGRTGPCVSALVDAGICRVVIAMEDPNPKVSGNGIKILKDAGINVTVGPRANVARELNAGFVLRMEKGRPLVRVKLAATIDGRTAAADGSSQWITSTEARQDVHHWRAASAAVVTGIGTITSDDPRLNARLDSNLVQPIRVVLDGDARLGPEAALFQVDGPVLVVTTVDQGRDKRKFDARTESINLQGDDGRVDLTALVMELGKRGCNDILVEAGAGVSGAFAARDLVDEYLLYLAPDLLGSEGRSMFALQGISNLADRIPLELLEVQQFGRDVRFRLRPVKRS
jgi:diaminohydroxyphosphoribosylaminopyrimidine deaminase/5-amino-6-(5-phosphoribosylamino)uracil reductase